MMPLTISYFTNRRDPKIQWFFDSLHQDLGACYDNIRIVVVDFYADEAGRRESLLSMLRCPKDKFVHVPPKPNVWQGKYRLTKQDYFAASNARNTALCLAQDGWIAYVDDLSVLVPGWIDRVRAAQDGNYIVYGTYQKVLGLMVDNGLVKGFREHSQGYDPRRRYGDAGKPVPAAGSWLYGCSLAGPVEAFLQINGWDEDADSLGSEDSLCGIMLAHHGNHFRYDLKMMTYESEEDHFVDQPFKRLDKGNSPRDKSHAILAMTMKGRWMAPNYFGPGGIREVRNKVLAGEPFPVTQVPQNDWFDGQPLTEM